MNAHYFARYLKFIQSRPPTATNGHVHHILPRAMGGTNDATNLISLSIREHFIAHWMLAKAFDNAQCWAAFRIMCLRFKGCSKVTSKMYELSEKNRIKLGSGLLKGQVWTDKGWVTVSEYRANKGNFIHMSSNKISVFNNQTGKTERIDKTLFDPALHRNIKQGMVNVYFKNGETGEISREEFKKNRHLYRTHNEGLVSVFDSEENKYVQVSKEEYKLGKGTRYRFPSTGLKLECPHCRRTVGTKRWHFNNCKQKEL